MSLLLVSPCRKARLTPGQPASTCSTFCPAGTVRAAVAVQSPELASAAVAVCARAAPAEQTSAATDSNRTTGIHRLPIYAASAAALPQHNYQSFFVEDGTLGPAPRCAIPRAVRRAKGAERLDLLRPLSRVPGVCRYSRETSAAPRRSSLLPTSISPAPPPSPASS